MSDNKAVWGEGMRVRVRKTLTYHPGTLEAWEAQIKVYLPADRVGNDVRLAREFVSASPRYAICGSILNDTIGIACIVDNVDCRYIADVQWFSNISDALRWLESAASDVMDKLACAYEENRTCTDALKRVCLADHIGYFHRLTFQARSDS